MKKIIVFIPDNFNINYFVYSLNKTESWGKINLLLSSEKTYNQLTAGRIKFRGSLNSKGEIINLIKKYEPDTSAIRVLYGGSEFKHPAAFNDSILKKLEKLIPHSPMDMPVVIELIKILRDIILPSSIKLYFETSFFTDLPVYEQLYAVDDNLLNMEIRRSGYHGIFHYSALKKIYTQRKDLRKIISICLEPIPEVTAILDGIPVMVSGGATPVEGIPGETTVGELDPGILLLIEEKKKRGAEYLNEIITRKSGLSAVAGKYITIRDLIANGSIYKEADAVFKYKLLLSCGSAIAMMNGFDAVSFSGRYVDAACKLSEWLVPELSKAAAEKFHPEIFYYHAKLEEIVIEDLERQYEYAEIGV